MKKIGFYVTALVAGVLAGCSNVEDIQTPSNEMEDFVAVMAEGKSRTTLGGEDGKSVLWSKGDELAIFRASGKGYNTKYTLKTMAEDGSSATFKYAGVYSPMEGTAPSLSLEKNYAVYPYSGDMTMTTAGVVNVTVPATQTYTANTFDANAAFMFAASDDQTLQFKNAHALLKIALTAMPGDDYSITHVKLSSEGSALSGAATIQMKNDVPEVTLSGTGKDLTLNCSDAVTVNSPQTATVFYLVVTPGTYSDLKLTLTGTNYSKELDLPASLTIARNKIVTVKYICGSDDFTGNIEDMESTEGDINLNE